MSNVQIATNLGFDSSRFWISNAGGSTGERFSGLTGSVGGILSAHQELTYSTFSFEANGFTYRYIGSFSFAADIGVLSATVSADGTYDRIEVLSNDTVVATYDGPSRDVHFGTFQGASVTGLVGNLLGGVTNLLFGSGAATQSYANLHTDATPNLVASAYADGVTAIGGGGDDRLVGGAGADVLSGGGGADALYGFAGNDLYVINDSADRAYEVAGGGSDQVNSSVNYSLAGQHIERLLLTGTANTTGIGNDLDNLLMGNHSTNYLDGGRGNDRMVGLGGDDTYFVNAVGDIVTETLGQGNDTVITQVDYTLTANVEILRMRETGDIDGTGNALNNHIVGNNGDNVINGLAGRDILTGNGGHDSFVFDTFAAPSNIDLIVDFNAIDDTIVLDNSVFTILGFGELRADAFKDISRGTVDATDRILYDHNTGRLFYDADGNGSGRAEHFATLQGLPGLTASDFHII